MKGEDRWRFLPYGVGLQPPVAPPGYGPERSAVIGGADNLRVISLLKPLTGPDTNTRVFEVTIATPVKRARGLL